MKRYRTALIGCGNIFPMHAIALQHIPNCELVAVCDIQEDRAVANARRYDCLHYTNYMEMLLSEDIDVVHLLTPHDLHAPMAIAAAEAGKHVLTEKPMALTTEQAESIIATCERSNVELGVIFQTRYNASSRLVKKSLQSGKLGFIIGGKCQLTWNRTNLPDAC
jgi:predicted dehydrogenase